MKKNSLTWIYALTIVGIFLMFTTSCKKDEQNAPVEVDDNDDNDESVDIDGNVYNMITIGTQVWMVENLKTTKYSNGDPISNVTDNSEWASATMGAQCSYDNNASNDNIYGKLYNWHAVNDSRKLAPTGWHIPSDAEWTTLTDYLAANLGESPSIVKALAANTEWSSSIEVDAVGNDLTINNNSGFTALPGGIRGLDGPSGIFGWQGTNCWWWSSSEVDVPFGSARGLTNVSNDNVENGVFFKSDGLSVRCIMD